MAQPERFETLVLGSGEGGKYLAWHMAKSERQPTCPLHQVIAE
jgi:hypothetical protein